MFTNEFWDLIKCLNRKSFLKDTLLTSPRHQTTKMQGSGGLMLHNEQHTDKKNIVKFSKRMLNWEKQRDSSPHTIFGACRWQGFHFIWNCFEDTPWTDVSEVCRDEREKWAVVISRRSSHWHLASKIAGAGTADEAVPLELTQSVR